MCSVPVVHAFNPSYSGGRDQKAQSSRSAWTNSSQDPISIIPNTKEDWQATQVVEYLPPKSEALSSNASTTNKSTHIYM
jgi:hypothetical protein